MKTSTNPLVSALALALALILGAAPPAVEPTGPTTGKVMILDNEHTLEGDIERVGGQYRIRRLLGETWVQSERVLSLVADAPSAYEFLRDRANLNDADERLRLAEWCRQHDLRDQAIAEVREAVRLRPNHGPSRRLLAHLELAHAAATTAKSSETDTSEPLPQVDVTADSLGAFARRVQPILMNTCAGCHASTKAGSFRLTRCYDLEAMNRKVVQQNLAAVLSQVNLKDPQGSPLLTKAVTVHGSLAQAPLKGRQTVAYRALEDWVRNTLATNPHLSESTALSAETKSEPKLTRKSEAEFAADVPMPVTKPAAPTEAPMPPTATPAVPPPARSTAPDAFDPAAFNRQMHPEKTKDKAGAPPPR